MEDKDIAERILNNYDDDFLDNGDLADNIKRIYTERFSQTITWKEYIEFWKRAGFNITDKEENQCADITNKLYYIKPIFYKRSWTQPRTRLLCVGPKKVKIVDAGGSTNSDPILFKSEDEARQFLDNIEKTGSELYNKNLYDKVEFKILPVNPELSIYYSYRGWTGRSIKLAVKLPIMHDGNYIGDYYVAMS